MKCTHTIHDRHCHHGWNNANAPVLRIEPGETVEFLTQDSSGGQLSKSSTLADLGKLDFGKVNPVTGPVHIDGAEPGDAIDVTLLDVRPSGWGWTANIPGFGLLADQFKDPALHIWKYDAAVARARPLWSGRSRAAEALLRHHRTCTRRSGAAFRRAATPHGRQHGHPRSCARERHSICRSKSLADCSASAIRMPAQGDGEVCGTAIESPCTVAAKFELIKGANLAFPRFTTPGP